MMPLKNAKDPYAQMDLGLMPVLNNVRDQLHHRQHAQMAVMQPAQHAK
jgi:hypothetical protein